MNVRQIALVESRAVRVEEGDDDVVQVNIGVMGPQGPPGPETRSKVVATSNQALTGLPVIDGYQTLAGDQVLLVAQSTPAQNGLWVVGAGAWARPADFANGLVILGRTAVVSGGATNAGSVWTLSTTGTVTIGTTAQVWINAPAVGLTGALASLTAADATETAARIAADLSEATTRAAADAAEASARAAADASRLVASNNLSDVASPGAARSNLAAASDEVDAAAGTGSLRTLGTGALQAAAGNDSRLSDQRVPIDGSVGTAKLADSAVTSPKVATGTFVEFVDVRKHGAALDGNTNNAAAVATAQAAAGGGVLYFPPGTCGIGGTGVALTTGNVVWRGAGRDLSVIKALPGATGLITAQAATGLVFEDLTFDGGELSIASLLPIGGNRHQRVTFRRCVFRGLGHGTALDVSRASRVVIEDCVFHADGTGDGRGILFQAGGTGHQVRRCRFEWLRDGIIVDNGASASPDEERLDFLDVSECSFEGGWWLIKADFAGEGGTVSYSAPGGTQVRVTDTAAAFSGIATPSSTNVRVMPVKSTGTLAASPLSTAIAGSGFVAAGVRRGDIVRCGTAWAVVAARQSDTVIRIEEWLDNTTFLPVPPPAGLSPFTVYGVWLGRVTSFTGTTATFDRLHDLDGQDIVAAAIPAGTRYEILRDRPNYQFQMEQGSYGASIRNCVLRRGWSDQIAQQGSQFCAVLGNTIEDGQDMGITLDEFAADCVVSGNRVRRQGAGGIYIRGNRHLVVGNVVRDSHWQNPTSILADLNIVGATDCMIANNTAHRSNSGMPYALWGFIFRGGGSNNIASTNHAGGHATAGYRFEADAPTGTILRHNVGSVSLAGGTPTIDFGVSDGTGAPEGQVVGSVGGLYRRRDGSPGSALYIKNSGNNTSTGWGAVSNAAVDEQRWSSAGAATWTKPTGGQTVASVRVVGGGGGGGSGYLGAPGTARVAGGGGAGGGTSWDLIPLSALPATVAVTVGAGGIGGAGQTVDSTPGNAGGNGGTSSFGAAGAAIIVSAAGGLGGAGGSNGTGGTGGTASAQGMLTSAPGGAASVTGGVGGTGGTSPVSGAGGAGGGITTGNLPSAGGPAGVVGFRRVATQPAGGATGQPGTSATLPTGVTEQAMGFGGGGGGAADTGGGAGGNGIRGGGGGGGGSGTNGLGPSGPGGNGGDGVVWVVCW